MYMGRQSSAGGLTCAFSFFFFSFRSNRFLFLSYTWDDRSVLTIPSGKFVSSYLEANDRETKQRL